MYELNRAEQLYQQERYTESLNWVQTYLSSDPNNSEAKFLLILNFIALKKLSVAEQELNIAISETPDEASLFFALSILELQKEQPQKAKTAIETALSFDTENAAYYGQLSNIQIYFREFEEALTSANIGLEYDPGNETCLNAKGDALTKLGRKDEANIAFNDSLAEDPENDQTFAFLGYSRLEQGKHKEALTLFRQSLALNPNNSIAIDGLKEAIKAKFFLYRWILSASFAISKLPSKIQMFMLVGLYILYQVLNRVADNNPNWEPFIQPFLFIYLVFAFSSWFLPPLSNFVLRLHSYGRYALNKVEKITSIWVGTFLILSLASALLRLILEDRFPSFPPLYFLFTAIAISATGMMNWDKDRKKMIVFALILGTIGLLAMIQEIATQQWGLLSFLFIGGTVGIQIYANVLLSKR